MGHHNWVRNAKDFHKEIIMGPSCPFAAHSLGSRDGNVPRYKDSHACVRCVAALSEGRVALDIHRIQRDWRGRFLEFWSFVDIQGPDDCWEWHGNRPKGKATSRTTVFPMRRYWTLRPNGPTSPTRGGWSGNFSAPRVAGWFSWGDYGTLPIVNTCGTTGCCNPLHLRVLGVPHFHHNRKLQLVNFNFDSRKLQGHILDFIETSRIRRPDLYAKLRKRNGNWIDHHLAALGPNIPAPDPGPDEDDSDPNDPQGLEEDDGLD